MMVLKRPRGSVAEHPAALRARLEQSWDTRVAHSLQSAGDQESADFPITVNIGRPGLSADTLLKTRAQVQAWITAWREIERIAPVSFETVSKRRVGNITLPSHLTFETIDEMATFLGRRAIQELDLARRQVRILEGVDERLNGMAPHWRRLAALSDEEMRGFTELIETRRDGGGDIIDIRELAISGLDTKWVETRSSMVRDALRHIDCLADAEGFREQMGFREDDRQEIWMKVHPDDMLMPMGDQEFAMRPSKIRNFPKSVRRVVVVENKATFRSFEPLPGVCLFFGSGNAISGTIYAMPFLDDLEILYWGDLDSFGMKILSRVRRHLRQTTSVMMDITTMNAHGALWTREPEKDRFTGYIGGLTDEEEAALSRIRDGHNRLEQEKLKPGPELLAEMGLQRAS